LLQLSATTTQNWQFLREWNIIRRVPGVPMRQTADRYRIQNADHSVDIKRTRRRTGDSIVLKK
jgi:hypothetical protein